TDLGWDDEDDDGGPGAGGKGKSNASPGKKHFDDFMLEEYRSIAQAHFNTNSAIATFFKNYLAIVGLPLPLAGVLLTYLSRSDASPVRLENYAELVLSVSVTIAVVGYLVLVYITNLRLDALLYARTVNGIRNHFCNASDLSLADELFVRGLPRSTRVPPYY